jgi:hypothetical protein
MENMTPLQQKAQQLREVSKRVEAEKQQKFQDKLDAEGKELISKFANSFPTLYNLLIASGIQIGAETNAVNPVLLLSCNGNKVTIGFERTSGSVIGWTLANKTFRSTLLSREEGVTTNREDEDRLIIAVEELLFSPQSVQIG